MDYTKIEEAHGAVKPHARTVLATRNTLIDMIRGAVEKQSGCIGTFYKNRGEHHTKDQTEEEYSDSPIVAIQNKTYNCYGGFEGNTVYDIFFHPDDGTLLVTLNGEAGEDYDEPIEHVQVEGLLCIVAWLGENGFVEEKVEDPWRCEECGITDVEIRIWVNSNSGKPAAGDLLDKSERYCNYCQEHTHQVQESELMITIEAWWNDSEFALMKKITGFRQTDFSPDDGYQDFVDTCHKYWAGLSNEEKNKYLEIKNIRRTMRRELIEQVRDYFANIQEIDENEEYFLNELNKDLEDYEITFVNKAALERHGFDTSQVGDSDLSEIACLMGDYYCDARFSTDLITACDNLDIPRKTDE